MGSSRVAKTWHLSPAMKEHDLENLAFFAIQTPGIVQKIGDEKFRMLDFFHFRHKRPTYAEAAAHFEVPEGTIRSRLSRLRDELYELREQERARQQRDQVHAVS